MTDPDTRVTFKVNGVTHRVGAKYDATLPLNSYLRDVLGLRGTKVMCREGGCGVCVVTATRYDPVSKKNRTFAINSCLAPLYGIHGWDITTTEGLGNSRDGFHSIQERLAEYNGSQCGYCSPGMVMNMYGLLQDDPQPSRQKIEDAFGGNICRCTGFRAILDAFKSFSPETSEERGLPTGCIDIEELCLSRRCPSGGRCSGQLGEKCHGSAWEELSLRPLAVNLSDSVWYRPTSLTDLYALLNTLSSSKVKLICGNTAIGVYKDVGPSDAYIDIKGISDLYSTSLMPAVKLGACVNLTQVEESLREAALTSGYGYCKVLADHVDQIGGVPVRNAGSWAGNLMMKHQHPDMPSDVCILLEAVGAKISIGNGTTVKEYSLSEFFDLDMKGKVIESVTLPKMADNVYIRSWKIMPRSQNAHAHVNACISMALDADDKYKVMSRPSIVYGFRGAFHANQTEDYLVGKQLASDTTLQGALDILKSEVDPPTSPSLTGVTFRKNLAVALFYKYVLAVCGSAVSSRLKSGGENLMRPESSGIDTYETKEENWPVNQPMPRVTSKIQTSGEAVYVPDLLPVAGEVHAALVLTTVGNATVSDIDETEAMKMPGVIKFLTYKDIPTGGKNNFMPHGSVEEVLSSGDSLYAGQAVAIIVADTQLHADEAATKVKVTYSNLKTPILTIEDAITAGSYWPTWGNDVKKGDAAGAIASADVVVKGKISMETQYHFNMETQTSQVIPTDDGVEVCTTTQWPDQVQQAVADLLNINNNRVHVSVKRLGGGYGSKISRNAQVAGATALAAHVLRRPVRMMMSLASNMEMVGKRVPYMADYEIGVSTDGLLKGVKMTYYADCGSSPNDNTVREAITWGDNAYFCDNWHFIPKSVKTNTPCNTYCRSPGSVPAIFIMEHIMDHVANTLSMDPLTVRRKNLYVKNQKTHLDQPLPYCNLRDLVTKSELNADIWNRKAAVDTFNRNNRWKKRGLATVPMKFGIYWKGVGYNVYVTIYNGDGSVAITHGGIEIGQGVNTKTIQVCAYELGISIDKVRVLPSETLSNSNSSTTGGSITSELCCMGVQTACKELNTRMKPVRDGMQDPSWEELVDECFAQGVDLAARSWVRRQHEHTFQYQSYGVTVTEVELDVLTGQNLVLRSDVLLDCGESLNPEIDLGQVHGAFVMGIGYWLTEKSRFDPATGRNVSATTWEYKPPTTKDIPVDFRVELLKNTPNPIGFLRSKAVGEPPFCMACSAILALRRALEAARGEVGTTDFFRLDGPATVEITHGACLHDTSDYILTE